MHLWRDRLNRWLSPLASRISLSPNAITTIAMLVSVTAAVVLGSARFNKNLFPLAAITVALGGFLDALDGAAARSRGLTSRFGDFLDHFFDRVSDIAILVGWTIGAAVHPLLALCAVVVVMLNGYIGTQVEATFGSRSYQGTGRGEFILAAIALPFIQYTLVRAEMHERLFLGLTTADWLTAALAVFAVIGIVERFVEAKRLGKTD